VAVVAVLVRGSRRGKWLEREGLGGKKDREGQDATLRKTNMLEGKSRKGKGSKEERFIKKLENPPAALYSSIGSRGGRQRSVGETLELRELTAKLHPGLEGGLKKKGRGISAKGLAPREIKARNTEYREKLSILGRCE